jgi:hypothetical protein
VLRREVEEERAKSSRLERQVEFLEGALDHERQRNERSEAVSLPWLQLLVLKHSRALESISYWLALGCCRHVIGLRCPSPRLLGRSSV